MRALVVVHEPENGAGRVGERLAEHGIEVVERLITTEIGNPTGSTESLGSPGDYDLIVPMGSSWSVYDTDRIGGWIGDELEFLRKADAADVPVLGVCFGAQALAAALGGKVVRADRAQVGWFDVVPEPGVGLPPGPWFQWHSDRFEPPPDSVVLAEDDVCVQAYTVRRHLGVQFHPEVDRAHLARWVEMGGREEMIEMGIDPEAVLDATAAHEAEVAERTNRLIDWFLTDIAKLGV